MPEYEETGMVAASPDAVFGYVSNAANLPEYIPHMVSARAAGGRVHVAADVQGRHEEGEAWLRSDPDRRRIDWGRDPSGGYRGSLEVSASGDGASVTIHLSTDREDDADEIRSSLAEALRNISARVDGDRDR